MSYFGRTSFYGPKDDHTVPLDYFTTDDDADQ